MTEAYATFSPVAFMNAMLDAAMLEPDSVGTNALFPTNIFDIRQSGEGAVQNSGALFTVPLIKPLIILEVPYGIRQTYMSTEMDEDWHLSIKFRVYGNNGSDIQDVKQRLEFMTIHRKFVLSQHGIFDVGIDEHPRMKPYDARVGFTLMEYTMRYRWTPDA